MENKVFGEIKTTEELNELAVNLRKTKEFDEIRQLCKENNIPDDAAEDFIAGKRLHLADPGHQEENDPNGDTGKMTGAGKRGENIRHFTSGQKDENTYGWPWNEVVKKYERVFKRPERVPGYNPGKRVQNSQKGCGYGIL